ncbi:FadR family transcriptional regulator [Sphingomonas sp. LB-2]|uniref:FadR/GntR family transcriptional regulator n=1 Tax=Sphingomonas caeni TaxID=2984949 RepID=UPI00223175DF|nr:FadR/GntR family transcriptional regulator [Sphingomonas caeni]MCW3846513.1 FadR family transcriptional regulator [Sphingomonas caeni]
MEGSRHTPRHFSGHDEIAAILGSEILSGARAPGSRMPTLAEMFDRFGVSRVLMREVIKTLTAKGMVASKSRVGTHVLDPSHWNWFDPEVLAWRVRLGLDADFLVRLAEMRRAVEPAGAALAARHRTAEQLEHMRATLDAMAAAGNDRRAFAQADLDFHIAVSAASGNPLFRSFSGVVETALAASFSVSSPADPAAAAANVARHRTIADAIEAGDTEAAAHAMLTVIDEGFARVSGERK